jgi:hypothetical protein
MKYNEMGSRGTNVIFLTVSKVWTTHYLGNNFLISFSIFRI